MFRKAIRANILCNPTGKKGKFRGIDWLVEHNNLYVKVSQYSLLYRFTLFNTIVRESTVGNIPTIQNPISSTNPISSHAIRNNVLPEPQNNTPFPAENGENIQTVGAIHGKGESE